MEEKTLLSLNGLNKSFGKTKVLEDINLAIKEGELLGLIGPSGAGKSTVLKILLGIQNKDKGKIFYLDKQVKNLKKIRKDIGYCTQDNAFYAKLNVEENIKFFGRLYGVKRDVLNERVQNLIKLTHLPKKTVAEKLSGGMKRRLDFAISLIHDPPIMILDEPTTGLDPVLRRDIWGLINRVSKTGKTVIVASHMLSEMEENCDRVAIIANGRVQKELDPRKAKQSPGVKNLEEYFNKVVSSDN